MIPATAAQTIGPYWHLIDFPDWADLLRADGPNVGIEGGERIVLTGCVTDGQGLPVIDGVASAVKLAEACGVLGLKTSKTGAYATPLPKAYLGAFAAFAPRQA